jgi:two-component system KDP operon response regulator KdpE
MLPDMNGLDLVRYVRKQHGQTHVPMLVVSGATGGFQMNRALEAGADVFLGKPVAVDELVQAVSTAIKV